MLVRGETGTGKELLTALLHVGSSRRDRAPVRANCAAIPEELAQSELFGHVRGAFTGAHTAREGLLRAADGGTLVLDEVGELSGGIQAKLLRAVQQGELQPVGTDKPVRIDVRLIACTRRDLRAEVAAGRFREDLYYRLELVELVVPSPRERSEDIPVLVDAFPRRFAARFDLGEVSFTPALVEALRTRPWPGNVRELENPIARLLALSTGGLVDVDALDDAQRRASGQAGDPDGPLRVRVAAFERGVIEAALREASGNHSEAARELVISRVTLLDEIRRYGLRSGPLTRDCGHRHRARVTLVDAAAMRAFRPLVPSRRSRCPPPHRAHTTPSSPPSTPPSRGSTPRA